MLSKLYNISDTYPFYNQASLSQQARQVAGYIACCKFVLIKPQEDNAGTTDADAPVYIILQRTQPGTAVFGVYGECYKDPWYITCTASGQAQGEFLHSGFVEFTSTSLPMYTGNQLMLLNECFTVYTPGVNLSALSNGVHEVAGIYPATEVFKTILGFDDGYNCQVSVGQSTLSIYSAAEAGKGKPKAEAVWGSDSQGQAQSDLADDYQLPTGVRSINANTSYVTFNSIGDVNQDVSVLENSQKQTQMTITLRVSQQT